MKRIISPSMLSADFGHLDRDTRMIDRSRAEWVHIDIMDGVFVPNISFGLPVFAAIDRASDKFMDVHLMIVEPHKYVRRFVETGADLVTFHYEAAENPLDTARLIRECGAKAGISLKPGTPVEVLDELLPHIDLVLLMSVEPGFGGQSFIEGTWEKLRRLRKSIDGQRLPVMIEVDGGVTGENAGRLFREGCDVLVAGSAVFRSPDPAAEIEKLLNA